MTKNRRCDPPRSEQARYLLKCVVMYRSVLRAYGHDSEAARNWRYACAKEAGYIISGEYCSWDVPA